MWNLTPEPQQTNWLGACVTGNIAAKSRQMRSIGLPTLVNESSWPRELRDFAIKG
jgi:hypothetical protein